MAALATLPEARWEAKDGAPQGVRFDTVIASSRPGRKPYRIVRDPVIGVVLHHPPCESWLHRGPGICRHVKRALALAEDPGRTFVADALELWALVGFNPDRQHEYAVKVRRLAEQAHHAYEELAAHVEWERERAERAAWTEEQQVAAALADFGGES